MATPHATDSLIEIQLSRGYVTIIDARDADLLARKWYATPSSRLMYARGRNPHNPNQSIALHRVILERMLGRTLEAGEYVDHIDGNPMNNARANLRLATTADNNRNRARERKNTSGYKGVSFCKQRGKWVAYISVNNRSINLGGYDTPEEAHEAYKRAAVKYFGEFARFE